MAAETFDNSFCQIVIEENQVRRLTIAPDGDQAGREAASALAERASALGWQVSLLPAPEGLDWNDVLTMKGEAA